MKTLKGLDRNADLCSQVDLCSEVKFRQGKVIRTYKRPLHDELYYVIPRGKEEISALTYVDLKGTMFRTMRTVPGAQLRSALKEL